MLNKALLTLILIICDGFISYRNCSKSFNTRAWLVGFFKIFGESMPHLTMTLLPSALTKRMIFEKMWEDHVDKKIEHMVVKWRQFYNIWNVYFPSVKIRKVY